VLALSIAGLLGDRIEPLWGGVFLLLAIALAAILHPGRRTLTRRGAGLSAPIAILSLVGTVPAFAYAAPMLGLAQTAGPSCFAGQCARGDRFAEAAALALALVAIGLLAGARTPGWRLAAWAVGIAASILGSASVVLPDVAGSVGTIWGVLVVCWGALVAASAEWGTRRATSVIRPLGGER